MHRITLIAALAIVAFAGLTGSAAAQSAGACTDVFVEANGTVLVDQSLCVPPASGTRSAAAAPSLCANLYANVNGTEVANQEVCLPPATRKASRRSAAALCLDVNVNINGTEQAQSICLPPAASRKARAKSRRAGGCVDLYLEANGTVLADQEICTPAKRR